MYLFILLIGIGISNGEKTKSSFQKTNGLYSLVSEHRYRLPYGRIMFPHDQMAGVHIRSDGSPKPSASGNTIDISRVTRPLGWPQDVPFCETVLPHAFNEYLTKCKIDLGDFQRIELPYIFESVKDADEYLQECICRIKFGLKIGFLPSSHLPITEEQTSSYCQTQLTVAPFSLSQFERMDSIPKYDMGSVPPLPDTIKGLIPAMIVDIIKIKKDQLMDMADPLCLIRGIPLATIHHNYESVKERNKYRTKVGSILRQFTGTEELQYILQNYDGHSENNWWVYGGQASKQLDPSGNDAWYGRSVNALYEYTDNVKYKMDGFGTVMVSVEPSNYLRITQFKYLESEYTSCSGSFASIVGKALDASGISPVSLECIALRILDRIRFIEQLRCILKAALLFGLGDLQITGVHVQTFETVEDIDRWIKVKFRVHYNVNSGQPPPTIRLLRSAESQIVAPSQHVVTEISRTRILLHSMLSVAEEVRRVHAGELSVIDAVRNKYSQIEQHPSLAAVLSDQFAMVSNGLDIVDRVIAGKYRRAVNSLTPANGSGASRHKQRRHP